MSTRTIRDLVGGRDGLLLPGVPNALTARVVEDLGFQAAYVTGAGVTNTYLGMPDLAFLSLTELAAHVSAIADAVAIPLVVDADTGFGNAVNVTRTVRVLERAGASAIQLEDQVLPKKCGHFDGQQVIPAAEMAQKVTAAVETRTSADTLVVARTDARAADGLDAAIERAARYADAGADVLFVEGLRDEDELKAVGAVLPGVPKLANIVQGGKTPMLPRETLVGMGYSVILYANAAMQGAIRGMQTVLRGLSAEGTLSTVETELAPWPERQRLVRKPEYDDLDARYAPRR
jgi:2-methylisocitrate lyase-like PEP mutase family enzyme